MATFTGNWGAPILLAVLAASAFIVFGRVLADYETQGRLSRPVALLQTGYFVGYALSSYAFLDSRLNHVSIPAALLWIAILLMAAGCVLVGLSMPYLGRQSFGHAVRELHTQGVYRYTRNPQLVGGFLFIAGYAMLWPSWQGALWAGLWPWISHLMVRAEERHLENTFGAAYRAYCAATPRFIRCPGL